LATDPEKWSDQRKARVGELYDLIAGAPNGLDKYQIAKGLDVALDVATQTIRDLRIIFGTDKDINLPATPNGYRQPWIYRLEGTYDGAREWFTNRVGDLEARLETIEQMSASILSGAPTHTLEYQKSDKINRTISYLRKELATIEADGAL